MTEQPARTSTTPPDDSGAILQRESGLRRKLSSHQAAMIGLGSTIGTGLFLVSTISVKLAGPAVILSFIGGSLIALTVMWALAEMSVALPTAGSFGLHAEIYLHPWAGFAIRYTYWLTLVIVVGSEVVAAAIYCQHWFANIPLWLWVAVFSAALIYVNAISIEDFGAVEYWLAMVKVVTIFVFLLLGAAWLFGLGFPRIGAVNYTAHGGFFPNGWSGVALGVTIAIFSYLGIEIVGATAGETSDPAVAVPYALRRTLFLLMLFYVGGLAVIVGIVPWNQVGLGESPFVRVFEAVRIPAAAHVMNFVVLSAALSSAACNLYFASRLLFSLSRGGYAPAALGRLNRRGMPVIAVLVSSTGMLAALVLSQIFANTAFLFLIGVSFFGGPFAWIIILLTHLSFRRQAAREKRTILRFAPPGPWSSLFGLCALFLVFLSTWWIPSFHVTLLAGPPWLIFITLCYFATKDIPRRAESLRDAGSTRE